jgi:hypothetical protein
MLILKLNFSQAIWNLPNGYDSHINMGIAYTYGSLRMYMGEIFNFNIPICIW